jgi:hypothetical protein
MSAETWLAYTALMCVGSFLGAFLGAFCLGLRR